MEHPTPGTKNDRERRPSSGEFAPGEFTKLFEEVLNTVDFIFQNGIDWKAFIKAFKEIQVQNEGIELNIQSIENKGDGVVVVKVNVPENANKEEIHQGFTQNYELSLKAIESEYKAKLEGKDNEIKLYRQQSANMWLAIHKLADKPINVEVNATAESKTMNDSTDNSRKIENKDGNVIGNILGDYGTISGTVAHAINQLPDEPESDQPSIKSLLSQLQAAFEADPELKPEQKAKALKQIQALAEAGKDIKSGTMKEAADNALTMLKGLITGLPSAAAALKAFNELLPTISSLFGL